MTLADFIRSKTANSDLPMAFDKKDAIEKALGVQVHTKGVKPQWKLGDYTHKPKGYDNRYDKVFKHQLLNQYPNESDEMYQYRLSIYSPIQKELASRFLTQITGTVLNPNNYSISCENERFNDLFPMTQRKFGIMLKFMLEHPVSFYAVLQINPNAGEESEAVPSVIMVKPTNMIMLDKESTAFNYNGLIYFMDKTSIVSMKNEKGKLITQQTYVHNFGSLPFWQVNNEFLDQYVVWCNEITKAHSDSQIVDKNFSHPIKQVMEPDCKACSGRGRVADPEKPDCETCTVECKPCNGNGRISMSPGHVYTIPEHLVAKMGGVIPKISSFDTPNIGIPAYHFGKWEKYYDKAENSLHLKKRGSASESGDAKREDRKDSYFFYQTIAQVFFNNIVSTSLDYVGMYANVVFRDNQAVHERLVIDKKVPKQFDLMTDADLIEEIITVSEKSDDSMLLAEMTYAMNQKIYAQNPELKKINTVLYLSDPLYGLTGNAEKVKLLSGIFSERDKWIHTVGYFALKKVLLEKGSEAFIGTSTTNLANELNQLANEAIPSLDLPE